MKMKVAFQRKPLASATTLVYYIVSVFWWFALLSCLFPHSDHPLPVVCPQQGSQGLNINVFSRALFGNLSPVP